MTRIPLLSACLIVLSFAIGQADRVSPVELANPAELATSGSHDHLRLLGLTKAGNGLAGRVLDLDSALGIPTVPAVLAPRRLSIPTIDIAEAPVQSVGVETDGAMEIPGATEVGWYRHGSTPDRPGSTVLAAHIAFDGVDGVFRHLVRLGPGDEVSLWTDDGVERRYRVVTVQSYPKDELPDRVFAKTGAERLVLITCGGDFNPSLRSYDSNVIAVASPVDDR